MARLKPATKPLPEDHRGRPRRPAQADRRPDHRYGRAVELRGDARRHPPLRPRHRRRQPAVDRPGLRREDAGTAPSSRCRASCSPTSRIVSGYCGGLSGVHAMWAGADWTWHKPVLRNDVITTEAHLKDLIEHQTHFAGRCVPADLPRRLLQPARRQGRRVRLLGVPHRPRRGARARHEVHRSARPRRAVHRRAARRVLQAVRGTRKFAARPRATGKT